MDGFSEFCKGKQGADSLNEINSRRTPEERAENARRAGIASGESRRRQKSMREAALALLAAKEPDRETRRRLKELGLDETIQDGLLLAMHESVKGGSVEAAKFLRDTSGQRPADLKEVSLKGSIAYSEMSDEQLLALIQEDEVAE